MNDPAAPRDAPRPPGRADAESAALAAPADADLLARLDDAALLVLPGPPAAGGGPRGRIAGAVRRLVARAVAPQLQGALDRQSRINLDLIDLLRRHGDALAGAPPPPAALQRARARLHPDAGDGTPWLADRAALRATPPASLHRAVADPDLLDTDDPAELADAAGALARALAPGGTVVVAAGRWPPAAIAALLRAAGLADAAADPTAPLVVGRR